jgi:hypothetical protein
LHLQLVNWTSPEEEATSSTTTEDFVLKTIDVLKTLDRSILSRFGISLTETTTAEQQQQQQQQEDNFIQEVELEGDEEFEIEQLEEEIVVEEVEIEQLQEEIVVEEVEIEQLQEEIVVEEVEIEQLDETEERKVTFGIGYYHIIY